MIRARRNVRAHGLPWCWGATDEEMRADYPCDGRLGGPVISLYRAVDVAAAPATVFRWICQLKVAPYIYDAIDNLGRRSPRTLTPAAEILEVGQRWMVFRIVAFRQNVHITGETLRGPRQLFGPIACTYALQPRAGASSRLVVRLDLSTPNVFRKLAASPLAWGDLLMMRKQLFTLKQLAERDASRGDVPR